VLTVPLPPDDQERYESHLESCPACREQLEQLASSGEPLLRLARQFGDPTCCPDDPTLAQVMEQLQELQSPVRAAVGEPADLSFLRPAGRPGLLGSLGTYEVLEVIGRGGMGLVLKALDPALQRLVALKVLAPHLAVSTTARRRFVREGRAAAAVRHEHVVAVHAVHEAEGLPYLVMQYVPGESLQARLDRAGPLDVAEVVRIGYETASGLAAAHEKGLIHRDIKPANLLLEDSPARVRITDFGLARAADDVPLTQQGVVAGTPEYMAPEQARGEPIDPRADLYALGCVLYACCTGAPPFHGEAPVTVLRRVTEEEPPPVREQNPDVPAWLEQFITRLLAKDPADRVQTAAEAAALLQGYLLHVQEPARTPAPALPSLPLPLSPQERRRPLSLLAFVPRRRHVVLALALALPAVLIVLGALVREAEAPEAADPALAMLNRLRARVQRDESRPSRPVVAIAFKDTPPESLPSPDCGVWKVTDADLKLLTTFDRLQSLDLTDARLVTDAALKDLSSLRQLRHLYLGRTRVTDAGLKDVAALRQLRGLGLEEIEVTDAGVRDVAGLTQLTYLNLGGTHLTDAGMKELAPLTQLRMLCLYDTAVTDAAMRDLLGFSRLEKLLIGDTAVTEAGLKELAPLAQLRTVDRQTSSSGEFPRRGRGAPGAAPPQAADGPPSGGGKGWAAAAAVLLLVIGSSLAGVWWLLRPNRRPGEAATAASEPDIAVSCPGCQRKLRARAALAGKKVKCPGCGQPVLVPQAAEPPAGGSGPPLPQYRWLPVLPFLAALGVGIVLLALGLLGAGAGTSGPGQAAILPAPQLVQEEAAIDEQVLALTFTPDGRKLVTAGAREKQPGQFMVWDVAAGKELVRVRGVTGIRGVAMAPDGQAVACGVFGGVLTLRDVGTGRVRAEAVGHDIGVNSVAFSPDGTLLVTAGLDRVLKLWDARQLQERRTFVGHTDMVFSVAFFSHGREFVSGGMDRTVRIWNIAAGNSRLTLRGHASAIETVAVSPDDRILATASWDRTVKFWDPATGAERATLGGHNGGVLALAFSPDGRLLASATDRGTVSLWDVATRQRVRTCQEHGAPAWSLAFSHDGKLLASGSSDRTARLWDVAGEREAATLSTAGAGIAPEARAAVPPEVPAAGSGARGWFVAAGLIVILVALSGFGLWCLVRRGQRQAEAPARPAAAPAAPDERVQTDRPPASVPPPTLTVVCRGCGKKLTVKSQFAGKTGKCPQCGGPVHAPESEPGASFAVPQKPPAPSRTVWPFAVLGVLLLLLVVFGGVKLLRHRRPTVPKASLVNVTVGCEYADGVAESGFHVQQYAQNGQPFRWTNGNGRLVIPIDRAKLPQALRVQLFPYRPANAPQATVWILVNQHELLQRTLPRQRWEQTFDLAGIDLGDSVVVEILSDTFVPAEIKDAGPDSRVLGVDVRGVTLLGPRQEPR
jgi:serine/threonine protein kinase